jgi:tetratricopeptide (TPR) repeat protein
VSAMDQTPSNAEAIEQLTRVVEALRARNDSAHLHLALGNLGKEYMHSGAVLKALVCFDEAVAIAQKLGELEAEALHTGNQGSALIQIGNYDMALRSLRRTQSLGRRVNQPSIVYDTLVAMASLEINRENADQAVDYLREALELAQEAGDAHRELNASTGLAQAHWETGEIDAAIEQYRAALELSFTTSNLEVELECCDRLATLYHQSEAYADECAILRQAIQRGQAGAGEGISAGWFLRLGEACLQQEDWAGAKQAFLDTLPLGAEQTNSAAVTRALGGLSVVSAELGELAEAYDFAQKAVQSSEQSDQPDLYAEQLILLAFCERDQEHLDQAAATAQRALDIFIQTENFSAEQRVRRLLDELSG